MANNKTYDNPIDKHIPWDGSEATDNLPVRGKRIEEFLKDQLSHKAGVFYYDTTNNRYLFFADLETRDEYLEDTTKIDLILGTFDAPFNYSAKIILETPIYNTIALGTTGNYLDFSFAIENKSGQPTGESVVCTYTFRKGSIKQVVTEQYAAGRNIHLNIDKYLSEGTNNITIAIQGNTTLAATTVSVVFQVVNLNLNTEMDISTPYDLRSGSGTMTIPFTVSGYGTKIVEWYIDGQKLDFVKDEDEVVDVEVSRTKYITLSNLSQGTHNLQLRAYTTVDGELFYSDTLYREFIIYTGISEEIITAVSTDIPSEYGIIETRKLYGLTQYIPYNLIFATFTPGNSTISEVEIRLGDITLGSLLSENNKVNEFSIIAPNVGNNTISIISGNTVSSIPVEVLPTTMKISEITNNLQLDFRAIGKNNNSNDKDSWTYGDYSATFSGFNWNNTSGWVGNSLVLNAGASFGVNLKPLSPNPSTLGKTIEIEFLTKNVNNDDAIICDLRSETTGAGILITATKLSLISEAGVVIETPFKNNESLRVAFVINKSSGSTNKCMSFIYINGKLARGTSWASSDRYISDRELLFNGTTDAEVEIKYVRIYDTALGNDQILNNHILYRSNITEMNEIYDRNDIYLEGTTTFDYEKMVGRLPVMIVTGNIPTLENTTNKDEQITVDIDYINLQYPEHSFSWKSAALRPQGTSSMGYPKKNFRPYSRKLDSTVCYDNLGKIVQDRLYSFKPGAQRVDCWCLKADYAESSGTHNTGIARLWNKVLVDAKIEHTNILGEKVSGNVLRTSAQQLAIASGFEYDVRTTIDGFPILLFYRLTVDDPLIFLGKYNFNNDKSTPSVFGFEGIPGFDNTKMQCWEILNNGNPLALFTSFENFDNTWEEAFESRYPDTNTPNTTDLKGFCKWMSGVTQEDFTRQKWEHLDIYKVAAYYVYLMRFGAVDQTVKNAMLTSEDGQKFYFINYDNDTINGLTNEGKLVVPWDATRETLGIDGQPYYAGPGSKLWNSLEADSEFMEIVRLVDEALYIAGLKYEDIIKMFDKEQAGKWVERVYNQDAQYKYIGPYVERGVNNLFMLQGDRSTHRKYWLARRFALFDSLWVSGAYKANSVEIKCTNNTPAGQQITIKAGTTMDYGYGINNLPRESNISLSEGEEHTFITSEVVNLGDPIRIYAAPNIESIDLSAMTGVLAVVTVANVYNKDTGTKLKKLIVGNATVENNSVTDISGLAQAERLEYLDVQNMKGLTSLNLSNQNYFKTLKAFGSGISSVQFANGAPVENLELPAQRTLTLEQMPYLNSLRIEDWSLLHTVVIKGCPNISKDISLITNWIDTVTADRCSLTMDNIAWDNVDYRDLLKVASIGDLHLKGYARLSESSQEIIDAITEAFGSDIFNASSDFYVDAPASVFISGPTEVLEGNNAQYTAVVFPTTMKGSLRWSLEGSRTGTSLDSNGLLTTTENGNSDSSLKVRVQFIPEEGDFIFVTKDIVVKKRIYPSTSQLSISGSTMISSPETYTLQCSATNITGDYIVEWALGGDIASVAVIENATNSSCVVLPEEVMTAVAGTISATARKRYNNSTIGTVSLNISAVNDTIAETDAGVCAALYAAGLCANEGYITKDEARLITAEDLQPGQSESTSVFYAQRKNIKSFDGFKYFTGVLELGDHLFRNCTGLTSITIPNNVTSIGNYAFGSCTGLTSITIPNNVTSITYGAFYYCMGLQNVILPNNIESIGMSVFTHCTGLTSIVIPDSVTMIENYAFDNCTNLTSVLLSKNITFIGGGVFSGCESLEEIVFPDTLKSIGAQAFSRCKSLQKIHIPGGVTSIGNNANAFNACSGLTSITIDENNTTYDSRDNCNAIVQTNNNKLITGCNTTIIPNSVTKIGERAFNYSNIHDINLHEGITEIENYAFEYCPLIKEITVPESCTLKNGVFQYSGVTKVTYKPSSVPRMTFKNCENLEEVIFDSDSSVAINEESFYYSGVIILTVKNLSYISGQVFQGCSRLKSVNILGGSYSIGFNAFYGSTELETLILKGTVTAIGAGSFSKCLSLKNISIYTNSAPTVQDANAFGTSVAESTGRNTYNTGENTLYVPADATGYETGAWLDPLCNSEKCGFTLSKTL